MVLKSELENEGLSLFELDLRQASNEQGIQTKSIQVNQEGIRMESQLSYTSDLCIIQSTFSNKKDLTDLFSIEGEYIKIVYSASGGTTINDTDTSYSTNPGHFKLGYGKDTKRSILMPKGNDTSYTIILIKYAYFLSLLEGEEWACNSAFIKEIKANKLPSGEINFPISFPLHHIIHEITNAKWKVKERIHYFNLKIKELLLSLYCFEQESKETIEGVNAEMLRKIEEAHDYIEANFRKTPTIKELSKRVLLNELQLKQGFKKVYGTTIRSYIIDLKMREAILMLKDYKINEIAESLGYNSLSHFITTFKKYYGSSPKKFNK
ncbi:AraC family transcriptional regulator [Limibacter armeniacum]|uniref:AraC family transcriptional regulator n=1 Tax=Limibacter armeniacum TaxID=466084 RepID=UPI002FE5A3D3